MTLRITTHEGRPAVLVKSSIELQQVLLSAKTEAQQRGMLNCIFIEAENGNKISMVLGEDETVLGFDYGHGDPPYYASKGAAEGDEPVVTCYIGFWHHTEFPRRHVIPLADGIRALQEFQKSGELPSSIQWEKV